MRSFLPLTVLSTDDALGQLARIDAGKGQRTDERVVHDLEGQHRQRLAVVGVTLDLGFGLGVDALDGGNVERRRQVFDDGVEQRLHALVLEGRAAEHREELDRDRALADQRADLVVRRHLAFEVVLDRGLVHVDGGFDHLLAVFFGARLEVVRDLDDVPGSAQLFVAPDKRVHLDEVDDALELGLGADRQLHDDGLRTEARS